MLSLVYISSATVAFTAAELMDLLAKARERNHALGITGMLLYKKGSFIQVLEGPDDAVRTTYARIAQDDRHKGCIRMLERQVEERSFAEWQMGFRNLNDTAVRETPGYSEFMNQSFTDVEFRSDPSRALRLLTTFRKTMGV